MKLAKDIDWTDPDAPGTASMILFREFTDDPFIGLLGRDALSRLANSLSLYLLEGIASSRDDLYRAGTLTNEFIEESLYSAFGPRFNSRVAHLVQKYLYPETWKRLGK